VRDTNFHDLNITHGEDQEGLYQRVMYEDSGLERQTASLGSGLRPLDTLSPTSSKENLPPFFPSTPPSFKLTAEPLGPPLRPFGAEPLVGLPKKQLLRTSVLTLVRSNDSSIMYHDKNKPSDFYTLIGNLDGNTLHLEASGHDTMKWYGSLLQVVFQKPGIPDKIVTFEKEREGYYKLLNAKFKIYEEEIEEESTLPLENDYMRIFGTITIKRIEFLTVGGARKTRKMRR
jgi:hypothetical protein